MTKVTNSKNMSPEEMANKIAEENFGGQKYDYIKEVIHYLKEITKSNCEFTSKRISKLFEVLLESGALQVKA